jgi:hypothetical protein
MSLVAISTYLILATYMHAIEVRIPFLNAIIPTVGYMLSTWSLPAAKKAWMRCVFIQPLDSTTPAPEDPPQPVGPLLATDVVELMAGSQAKKQKEKVEKAQRRAAGPATTATSATSVPV